MRSAAELLAYIDEQYELMLQRPHMYAASPAMLEGIFTTLEEVREFILSPAGRGSARDGYSDFLVAKGFGAIGFTGRDTPTGDARVVDASAFSALCDFWREFLSSPFRTRNDADTKSPLDGAAPRGLFSLDPDEGAEKR